MKKGFTLIEMIATICIISILAAITIPVVNSAGQSRILRQAGDVVQSVCMETRHRALAMREKHIAIFFNKSTTFDTSGILGNYGGPEWEEESGAIGTVVVFYLPQLAPMLDTTVTPNVMRLTQLPPLQTGAAYYLPQYTQFVIPEVSPSATPAIMDNFALVFWPDGTVQSFPNTLILGSLHPDDAKAPRAEEDANKVTDLEIYKQHNSNRCYIDVSPNTGRVYYTVHNAIEMP